MARWNQHKSHETVILLNVGDSGSGKTHQLGLLANAGYRVFVADFSNGLSALRDVLTEEGKENFYFHTLKDGEGKAWAWKSFKVILRNNWKESDGDKELDLGGLSTWGPKDVFAIDDISGMMDACRNDILQLSGASRSDNLSQPQWGTFNREVNDVILRLTSGIYNCNVVVNAHWQPVDDDAGVSRLYPRVGSKANCMGEGGRHFDNVIATKAKPRSATGERVFQLIGDSSKDLKIALSSLPKEVPADMPDLFNKLTAKT